MSGVTRRGALGLFGARGSSCLEDLMLMRKDGAEPIQDVPANVIIV
jgi:hypothetical protein